MRRRSRPLFCPAGRLVEVSPGPQGCRRKTTFSKAENRPYRNGKCGRGSSHQQSIRDKSTTFLIGTNTTGKILCCHPYHAFNRLPTADTTMLYIGPQNISSGKPAGHVSNVQMLTLGPVWKHTGRDTKKPTLVRALWLVTVRLVCRHHLPQQWRSQATTLRASAYSSDCAMP